MEPEIIINEDINEALYNSNFDFKFKASTYHNFNIAVKAFESFKKDNKDFFSYDKRETIYGHILTYVIERQIYNSAFNPGSNYNVYTKEVNKYKYKAFFIDTKDFTLNIYKSLRAGMLPSSSKYKLDMAKSNLHTDGQICFNITNEYMGLRNSSYYGLINYGYYHGELTHLNIVIPTYNLKHIAHSINISKDVKIYDTYIPKELEEESVVALKKSIEKSAKNKFKS